MRGGFFDLEEVGVDFWGGRGLLIDKRLIGLGLQGWLGVQLPTSGVFFAVVYETSIEASMACSCSSSPRLNFPLEYHGQGRCLSSRGQDRCEYIHPLVRADSIKEPSSDFTLSRENPFSPGGSRRCYEESGLS